MAITLWNLFEASLLCLNAVCILNEDRFLSKIGWGSKSASVHGFGENPSTKAQLFNLLHSIRTVARVPLILLNIITILIKLILG
ncbi:unnamed protein product [Callosobruchus maculatus]|uniref:Immediate early response 3-interacting protein 1 n=1 Tax=Callosobruchus maculatus TaxID=64391 RepID=A0A653C6Y8_CALMS|nr:unnamed protein product [Callosobruchus maculatus]